MSETTGYQSSTRAHNREHEFFSKKLEYEEFRLFEKLKHQNQRFAYETETKKLIDMISKESLEIDALATKSVAEISSKQYGEVLQISSKAKLESSKLDGEKIRYLYVTLAKGKKDSTLIKANEFKYNEITHSKIVLNVVENKSKAILKLSDAEEKIKQKMKSKRDDSIKRAQIAVISSLSENANLNISGSTDDDKFAQVLGSMNNGMEENDSIPKISSNSNSQKQEKLFEQQKTIENLKKELFEQETKLKEKLKKEEEEISLNEEKEEEEKEEEEIFDDFVNPTQFLWIGSKYAFLMKESGRTCTKKERTGWNFVTYSSNIFTIGKYFFEVLVHHVNENKLMAIGLSSEFKLNQNQVEPNENLVICLDGHQHNLIGENGYKGNDKSRIGIFVDMDNGICRFFMNGILLRCYGKLDKSKQYRCCVHLHHNEDEISCHFPEKIPKKILELTSKSNLNQYQ